MLSCLTCEECGCLTTDLVKGWRGYLIDLEEEGAPQVAFFCPACVEQEFLTPSDGDLA